MGGFFASRHLWLIRRFPDTHTLCDALPLPLKIGAVLVLILLVVFGVGVIALASLVLLRRRQAEVRDLGSRGQPKKEVYESEREVYEALYPKRSTPASLPVERPPEGDE